MAVSINKQIKIRNESESKTESGVRIRIYIQTDIEIEFYDLEIHMLVTRFSDSSDWKFEWL